MECVIEEGKSVAKGDAIVQAVLKIKGKDGGRDRLVRGRPRTLREDAESDAKEMKEVYLSGGAVKLRELQTKQRLQSRS